MPIELRPAKELREETEAKLRVKDNNKRVDNLNQILDHINHAHKEEKFCTFIDYIHPENQNTLTLNGYQMSESGEDTCISW